MEYKLKAVRILVMVILLIFFVWLVISGQTNIGYLGLAQMIVGYAGVLVLLFLYNKPYSR